LGGINVGDLIIIILPLGTLEDRFNLTGKTAVVVTIDATDNTWPFKVLVDGKYFWVNGVLHSPLLEELF